jgi:hypothetical protein
MSDEFKLRLKVLSALNSKACGAIAFQAAGISVMGYHYGYLADLVAQYCVDIKFGVVDPAASAEYDHTTDTLRFSNRNLGFYATPSGRAQIIHECTHALIDAAHPGKPVRRSDNEFICWLAQTIYSLLAGDGVRRDGDFHGSLFAIASDAIRKRDGVFMVDPQAVSFVAAILRSADALRAKKAGKTVPDIELMDGIRCPRPPAMEPD